MKALPLAALLAAAALSLPASWQHNPRERTAKGIEEWQRKDLAAADRSFDEALELGGETAHGLFNAGTGRLGAGTPGAALPLLARAAEAARRDASAQALQPEALFNLGNAYLAAGEARNAVESYRAALRLLPGHQAAKHNLELALREQQKNEEKEQQQQQQQHEDQEQQERQQRQRGPQQPPQQLSGTAGRGPEAEGSSQRTHSDQQADAAAQSQTGDPRSGQAKTSARLPGFNAQKDMSAEQAASLLEAVENLEREQRRARAEQQRRERAQTAKEKDW